MWEIAEEEYERFLNAIAVDDINPRMRFCDCDDFEDEYSHNEIRDSWPHFLAAAQDYINSNSLKYELRYGADCLFVENLNK